MSSIDHVTIRVADVGESLALYSRVFELLGFSGERYDGDGFHEWNDFSIARADDEHPPTRGLHIAFAASDREQIDRWWSTLTGEGQRDDGAPGLRPEYGADYYGAFIRDGQANSVEAARHDNTTADAGLIDHLWIRVRDLAAAKRFYTAVAPVVGLEVRDRGERLQLIAEAGSFTLLDGIPTENLHLAIGVDDEAGVAAFHLAGLAGGGQDNGSPGERPQYHPGYYAAYVIDPGGNNVEAVWHNR